MTGSAAGDGCRPRILFLNRSYWPDAEATGQLLAELCEDLAGRFDVTVIAGQPNQNPAGAGYHRRGQQTRRGVRVRRVWHTRFAKRSLAGRAVNLLSYLGGASLAAFTLPRPQCIVVETDPPLLCLAGALLRRWHAARLVVYLQDIYPDIAVALGVLPDGQPTRLLRRLIYGAYRRADRVVVLSRDMRDLLARSGVCARKIECIPNWTDTRAVLPRKEHNAFRAEHGLDGRFVVMYSGNMGLCQRLEDVLAAAARLRSRPDVLFLLVGDGVSRPRLENTARRMDLPNVRFLPYQPKDRLAESLSAADLHLVPLDPRVREFLMPSKLYGILASGTPMLAIAPEDCELAEITRREAVGLVVPPGEPEALAEAVRGLADGRGQLAPMGRAARRLAEARYDRRQSTSRFAEMLEGLVHVSAPASKVPFVGSDRTGRAAHPERH